MIENKVCTWNMIKIKTLQIKVMFMKHLEIWKPIKNILSSQTNFCSKKKKKKKHYRLFMKIVIKNYFLRIVLKIFHKDILINHLLIKKVS